MPNNARVAISSQAKEAFKKINCMHKQQFEEISKKAFRFEIHFDQSNKERQKSDTPTNRICRPN